MSNCVIAIGSVTQSMKAIRILNGYSIPATTVKLSSDGRKNGCLYGIEFNCMHSGNISKILNNFNIRYEDNSK